MSATRIVVVAPDDRRTLLLFPTLGAAEAIDHAFDFSAWVARAPDDAVAGVAVILSPDGATIGAPSQAGAIVVMRITGNNSPGNYTVVCSVATPQGRQKTAVASLVILPAC